MGVCSGLCSVPSPSCPSGWPRRAGRTGREPGQLSTATGPARSLGSAPPCPASRRALLRRETLQVHHQDPGKPLNWEALSAFLPLPAFRARRLLVTVENLLLGEEIEAGLQVQSHLVRSWWNRQTQVPELVKCGRRVATHRVCTATSTFQASIGIWLALKESSMPSVISFGQLVTRFTSSWRPSIITNLGHHETLTWGQILTLTFQYFKSKTLSSKKTFRSNLTFWPLVTSILILVKKWPK